MYGILFSIYLIRQIGLIGNWSKGCWNLLFICLASIKKDQIKQDWARFFVVANLLLEMGEFFGYCDENTDSYHPRPMSACLLLFKR